MAIDPWFPVGFRLPDGAEARAALSEGEGWQILGTRGDGRALVAQQGLAQRWITSGLLKEGELETFQLGKRTFYSMSCGPSQVLCPVSEAILPGSKSEALSFALALKASRAIDEESPLQDSIYVEKATRLLPTYSISSSTEDAVVLGYWLSGGASIPVTSFRRLRQAVGWIDASQLKDVIQAAGFDVSEIVPRPDSKRVPAEIADTSSQPTEVEVRDAQGRGAGKKGLFELAGRPELTDFFNEHIVDIILNRDRYKALGIDFPSAVILHGPPGTGKTFAVERLVDFLGWPSFQIDASSVASPYIHETSKKVAQVFEKAIESAPSVLVIDEMEAFLADREMGSGHHRVEEIAEFLRRIPEAAKSGVLIVAMTNRIDMIDPAIRRRGRFDHVVHVGYASEVEVNALMHHLLSSLPKASDLDPAPIAKALAGRPLSDVTFVVREAARLAARSGKGKLDQESLKAALQSTPAREAKPEEKKRRIGFV